MVAVRDRIDGWWSVRGSLTQEPRQHQTQHPWEWKTKFRRLGDSKTDVRSVLFHNLLTTTRCIAHRAGDVRPWQCLLSYRGAPSVCPIRH